LKRCRSNLFMRDWRIEVEEHFDVSAHASIMPSRDKRRAGIVRGKKLVLTGPSSIGPQDLRQLYLQILP
jgi:hypothetical protein